MTLAVLALGAAAMVLSCFACAIVRRVSLRVRALDTEPIPGQTKAPRRAIPNTGGIGITFAILATLGGTLAAALLAPGLITRLIPSAEAHLPGLRAHAGEALALLGALLGVHILGLVDDRRPLPAMPKLGAMLAIALGLVLATDTRLLTLLDAHAGGPWLSIGLTVLWLGVVSNALNFMDNMDGLTAGVAAIAAAALGALALVQGEWFVAAALGVVAGSSLGFLTLNYPPARLFMGDGGSLVLGMALGFLTVRATYLPESPEDSGHWHAALVPLVVLAVPLYDFTSVVLIRLAQGKSPFKGDLQHFSHRIHRRGLSPRATAGVIHALTAVTAMLGLVLATSEPWQAALLGASTLLLLCVIALFEHRSTRGAA